MCGIFGCVLHDGSKAAPLIHSALKRLEYRGYDSVGEVSVDNGKLSVKKDKGRLEEVHSKYDLDDLPGSVGVGHTRWATHGRPAQENSHPHVDCKSQIAVVHNGIIENYLELKKELESKGHQFNSRTDTEVVPHLVEEYVSQGIGLEEAFRKTVNRLEGAYSIVLTSTLSPKTILCARQEGPLVLGLGDGEYYCASDFSAFLPLTKKAVILDEGEMAVLNPQGVRILKLKNAASVKRDPITITWDPESAKKQGFKHFMLKEIHEQGQSIRDALRGQQIYYDLVASKVLNADKFFIVACGTSYHAGLVGSLALAKLAGINARVVIASEFSDEALDLVTPKTAVLAISQSGETMDTLNAVRDAKSRGASILSIVNVLGSTLMRLSDVYIGQNAGPEIGVASTKAFTSQVAILLRLAANIGRKKGEVSAKEISELENALHKTPGIIQNVINTKISEIKRLAEDCNNASSICFLGRGISVPTALEGRLKLLELSYIPAIAYPAGESKHGFIALIEDGFPVIFVAPKDDTHKRVVGNIMEMKARGARIISIIEEGDEEIRGLSDQALEIPESLPALVTPLVYVVPLQLLAYHLSVIKGHDPDYPRNLAKSVTVE
ncbi:MAG TPA: glutamine--fructose-6-phosphate transaminase (isomerizing) [Candidatus Bathyarchaeia archaeon]|nr:glutamine--fructose-6-phosphate transaminase (isomerizing) [Candidatus Bathyarchaeia archaeon]